MRWLALFIAFALAACSSQPEVGAGADWPLSGGDVGGTHHSRLTQIDRSNVDRIGLAWEYDVGTNRGLEATPIVIDGVMYTSGVAGRAYALNAATGAEIWAFTPDVDMQVNRTVCCDMVNRGVAVHDGKVFVGALDGVLYALDAATGAIVWHADTKDGSGRGINITGAPEVAGDVVIIGNGGAEYDVRGYVTAYDVESGEERWRFYTVPRDPDLGPQDHPDLEAAVGTWDPESRWDIGGGGTPWDAIHYDPEFDAVYVGTGNGGPYHRALRSPAGGDNLYLSSIVALDPETGRVKWYYQETPGDSWDYTATQPMVLAELEIEGELTPVILHAPKNGFLYVIDRRDGSLLAANPIVYTNWADSIDLETGRPNFTPEAADYSQGPRIVYPASPGARNWHPISFDPETGLLYGAVLDMANLYMLPPEPDPFRGRALNSQAGLIFGPDIAGILPTLPPPFQEAIAALPAFERVQQEGSVSELRAIDPLTGETRWAHRNLNWQDRAGALTTASGLVFYGSIDGNLRIFDRDTGELLRTIETGTAIIAAPMSYEVDGVQYVAVMAAWGGGGYPFVPHGSAPYRYGNQGRILVFRLDGAEVPIPEELPEIEPAPEPPVQFADATPAMIARGQTVFFQNCGICHSNQPRSITPDLRRMQPGTHEAFDRIVLEGLLVPNGMPRWDDILSPADVHAIHAWLIASQAETRRRELALQRAGEPLDAPSSTILSNY
ncbi:PQQ-dependent dehydrogenase, methanol/ethanol family [Parasphingopyxis marina]|uniref:PQQ-dependent dehydrogenase, methanol/ethanol family n=1 Tax=Parasphingopyxis marina TaxID=2761622 RepID=A0A842HT75_9SPHN|nr:PQQ-dependent dehydrogenase, methanol/ethanol family [Parasphingopyxis marina]MBC2777088.1 PQQ-dependent dehydrogenase, methanol/ethanol family [Parasphingopyxis marina]